MSQSTPRSWGAVLALALAAFIFNTSEHAPIALLSDIGTSFAMSHEAVGWMITLYAWTVLLTSLPLMLLARRIERRKLLIGVFLLFIVGQIVAGEATSFAMLMVGRLGVALAHALFWSITAALAVRVAPEGKARIALSLLSTGTALALILGLPVGRLIGQWFGWRTSFLAIGGAAALTLLWLAFTLPRLESRNAGSLRSLPLLWANAPLRLLYLSLVLIIAADFTVYSYIEPFAAEVARLQPEEITLFLLVTGGAGLLGSYAFGRWSERGGQRFAIGAAAILLVCFLLIRAAAGQALVFTALCIVWGAALMAFALAQQASTLRLARRSSDVAMSIFSSLFNLGIGAGAFIGGLTTHHLGLPTLGFVAAGLAVLGFAACWRQKEERR
ncbi:MAG: sugar transporter [Zoogloeaceae bacterium]|jgi:multidrug resistance protein|nr:sugar transporter [Zoogloeaceae bacterium]